VVTRSFIGAKTPQPVQDNLAAIEPNLPHDELRQLDEVSASLPGIRVGVAVPGSRPLGQVIAGRVYRGEQGRIDLLYEITSSDRPARRNILSNETQRYS